MHGLQPPGLVSLLRLSESSIPTGHGWLWMTAAWSPTSLRKPLQGKDITVYGDGTQTRSFQYIDDLIEGIVRMADSSADFTGPVNIGNPEEHTIKELARRIIRLTGSNSSIVQQPSLADDPHRRCPNISLAYKKLGGWHPTVNLDTGLEQTIEYFRCLKK